MSKLLKIGEFSKLCHTSIKTLRYYEEKGLLIPAQIDAWTGYRFYRIDQVIQLSHILHLKSLGLSLNEIYDVLNQKDDQLKLDLIQQKLKQCNLEISKLLSQKQQLETMIHLQNTQHPVTQPTIRALPAHIAARHRQMIKNYDALTTLCTNTIAPEMMRLGCTCPEPQYSYMIKHSENHHHENIDITYCEAVGEMHENTDILQFFEVPAVKKALCYAHLGSYDSISDTLTKLITNMEANHCVPTDDTRFCFINGPWNKQNPEEYLTEIQIPIL